MRNRPLYSGLLALLVFFIVNFLTINLVRGQIEFSPGSDFRYLKGKDAAGLSSNWMAGSFDDSGWSSGNAPIRYGDGAGGTVLDDMLNTYSVVYMRTTFMASNVDSLGAVELWINFDDGFVIWINGKRVLSQYAPTVLSHDGFATDLHESGQFELFTQEPGSVELVEGENTLAIQAFNFSLESTDFLMDLSISSELAEPVLIDTIGLDFSVPSGFYEDPFTLEIAPSNPAWQVVYTLDGSNPRDSRTAVTVSGKASILIDPYSSDNRAQTPVFMVRASSSIEGVTPTFSESRTYIFLDWVLGQEYPGGGWPTGPVNNQVIDLDMDQRVVYHPDYQDEMIPALTDIPSISIATDLLNLFHPETGIYVNAEGHGFDWERECAVELIYPDGSEGFNVNAGLRIRGGWSRHSNFPKHAFRLFFRSDYGDAKLDYPLFGDEGVDHFDKIDLRCAQNWAWSHPNEPFHHTFLRDVFSRDIQRDMDQPYTRSRYYHLYLNGMYWGLFQTQERSEARFAADYLGGKTDDYDVIKVNTEDYVYQIEATDGNMDAWFDIWKMCEEGFADNASYYTLLGLDEKGMPAAGRKVYVDMDNLIDYMLTIFYTGNFDSPTTSFRSNEYPNNFYAIYDREDQRKGFIFFAHDAEHSLFAEQVGPGFGLEEDRVNLAEGTNGPAMKVYDFSGFHPQWLHYKLTDNAEYRMRFMDRANRYLQEGGLLTSEKNLERLNARAAVIEAAMIGESARWGDASRNRESDPYTRNDEWIPEVNKIRNDFFPYRTEIVIGQLEEAGLYSALEPPVLSRNGTPLQETVIRVTGASTLLIENRNSSGSIWYTLDGSDPRITGGSAAPGALPGGTSQVELNVAGSAVLKARILYGDEWSALKEIYLVAEQQDYSDLAVTELHYHPRELVILDDTTSSKDLEFIEFKNTGEEAINLGDLVLDSAVYYEFPVNTLLPPGQFYVVASKPSAFYLRYGLTASGNYQKNFSNGGEEVLLRDMEGNPVIHFFYSDDAPWPIEADGEGNSLVSTVHDPTGNPASSTYWMASRYDGGSPFQNDPVTTSDQPARLEESEILVYPNPTSDVLHIRWPDGMLLDEATFQLFGLNGNLLYRTDLSRKRSVELDHLNLSPGVYIVRLSTGGQEFRKKIIYQ